MIKCPICKNIVKDRGLVMHLRNNHREEYDKIGYRELKKQAEHVQAQPLPAPKPPENPGLPQAPNPIDSLPPRDESDKAMDAWYERTGQKMFFTPTPAASALINQYGSPTNPHEFINNAIVGYGKSMGVEAAIIKTEGGKTRTLVMGGGDSLNKEDKEFNQLLKLITAQGQINQSYNANSPMNMMMQIMKEQVNDDNVGMGEIIQTMVMMKVMEGL